MSRTISAIVADLHALPLSRDPTEQLAVIGPLAGLLGELEDHGFEELPPSAAEALLGVLSRMLPLFDDPEFTWEVPGHADLFPRDYYLVNDTIFFILEVLPGRAGFPEAIVALVRREPQAWNVRLLIELAREHPTGRVGATDLFELIGDLKRLDSPRAAARVAREFRRKRRPAEPDGAVE